MEKKENLMISNFVLCGKIFDCYGWVVVDNVVICIIIFIKMKGLIVEDCLEIVKKLVDLIEVLIDKLMDCDKKDYWFVMYKEEVKEKIMNKDC